MILPVTFARPLSHSRGLLLGLTLALLMHPAAQAGDHPGFDTNEQELLYFWGTQFGNQLDAARITDKKDVEWVVRGLRDRVAGTAQNFGDEYPSLLNNYLIQHNKEAAAAEAEQSRAYIDRMGRESGAVRTEDGLVYLEVQAGDGAKPEKDSNVTVHYVGTLRNGKVFDNSRERGAPLKTRLTSVIACWSKGIPMMKVGGKAKITCPPELAYGERGNARIPGGSALTFEVELLGVDP